MKDMDSKEMDIEKRIASTNRWGLIALLHELLIDKCKDSKKAIENEEYEELNKLANRNRDILTELIVLFSEDDKVSTDLREIYLYINSLLTDGEIKRDASFFENIVEIVHPILDGFKELERKEDPNVVTGLTYGKSNLEEHKNTGKEFKG